MNILLRAQGLVAGWQQPATRALDLAIAAGEVVGLTGPNGVGKSTVLARLPAGRRFLPDVWNALRGCVLACRRRTCRRSSACRFPAANCSP